ncbi:Pentatricopeptide repeat-containing protein At2g31400 [Durusdinium trenchii]|uniref:Chloroplastic n=1 Tax=Durusdinium trenchii TaxID=1381693 RepID=A0ABP0PTK2_9DINO
MLILHDMLQHAVQADAFVSAAAVSSCDTNWELALSLLTSLQCLEQVDQHDSNWQSASKDNWQVPVSSAINVCGFAGQWTIALGLFATMLERSKLPNVVTYGTVMSSLERSCRWAEVLELWDGLCQVGIERNVYIYSVVMGSLEKASLWGMACGMFVEMKRSAIPPTSVSYDVLMRSCRRAGWQRAFSLLDSMQEDSVKVTVRTLNAALSVLEAENLWAVSLHLLRSMKGIGVEADIASYSTVASTCAATDAWQLSINFLEEARTAKLELDTIFAGVSIWACEKGSRWQQALGTLMDMASRAVKLSEISLSSVLRGCQSAGRWEEALSILFAALEWRAPMGVGMYNAALGACSSSRSWERVVSLFETARSFHLQPDAVTLTTLMSAYETGFQWQFAVCTLVSFWEEQIELDATACNVATSSCASLQKWRAALALVDWMGSLNTVRPDLITYNTLLGSCNQQESWQVSLLLLEKIRQRFRPDLTTYHAVLEACAIGHAWATSLQILEEIIFASLPSGIGRNLAASACRSANQIDQAKLLLLENLQFDSPDVVTFKAILGLAESGDMTSQAPYCLEALGFCAGSNLMEKPEAMVATHSHSDMLGPAQAVVAVEMLDWHQYLHAELYERLVRQVGAPARKELHKLCEVTPQGNLGGYKTRLQNQILERQFGLSPPLSLSILAGLNSTEAVDTWCAFARFSTRGFSHFTEISLEEEPTSKDLAAWASWSLLCSVSRSTRQGYGSDPRTRPWMLLPLQVQHDRSPHAERQLLLAILKTCHGSTGPREIFGTSAASSSRGESALLRAFGDEAATNLNRHGSGSAEFLFCGSAESAEEESKRPDSSLALGGKRVEIIRGAPRWSGSTDTGAFQQAFVTPTQSKESLDVVIVRGQSSSAGIGMVAELAKTKTTTIVIWDRHHKQRDESKVASSVKKKTFTEVFAEQGPDKAVMQKAEEFFSVGAPKCALVHLAEEQLKTEAELERPLSKVNDLMDSCRHNHLETIANFNVFKIYKPWIHANRACTFVLIPPKLCRCLRAQPITS